MGQEEQNNRCSGSSSGGGGGGDFGGGGGGGGGGRPSKKPKQKKIPQRGLGVAQLEKIRLEEQNKKNGASAFFSDSSSISSSSPSFSSFSLPNHHHQSHSSPLIPFPSPSPPNLHSPTSQFRQQPNIDILHSNTVPLPNPVSNLGLKIGFSPSLPVSGHGNAPKLWNYELNLEGENPRVDHGLVFQPNLPYESSPVWPLPPVIQRAPPFQTSSPTVNVSGTSSSSGPNFQIEPPSNQSYYGNNYTSTWPEEEKMVGVKRPYPFSLNTPSGPSFSSKFPTFAAPIRSDESASYGNGGTLVFDRGNPIFREGPSCSNSLSELDSKKGTAENGGSNGDFLSLAPPSITSPHPNTRSKKNPIFFPYQGNASDPLQQQLPFYSFLPPVNPQNGTSATSSSNCNGGEIGGSVDLNLKL